MIKNFYFIIKYSLKKFWITKLRWLWGVEEDCWFCKGKGIREQMDWPPLYKIKVNENLNNKRIIVPCSLCKGKKYLWMPN